ncbi:dnaJ homolog subfamily C member 4 isoform X2 [Tenrec ecaudatus]|uniref:dnaJ homolog subfamily C member 4 isoform X2 n=1 Tax=Tenrec ecaudatus TaxID=94439 RepID=UPI003F5A86FE
MPPLLTALALRLCRLCPRCPHSRLLGAAAGQRSGPRNYYELLGVQPGASPEEIKRAFFTKSKELHPDRDPRNPALHSRFVELNEAYHVLSHKQNRRSYDHQLRSARPPESPGTAPHPRPTTAHQAHSSWEPPNTEYWAQFHHVRTKWPEGSRQQQRHNQRVLGYCLLLMLAGMGLHYVAFRKLEQMHRNFMDEKDRIITAIYNDTRARARSVTLLSCPPLPWHHPPRPLPQTTGPSPQSQQHQAPAGTAADHHYHDLAAARAPRGPCHLAHPCRPLKSRPGTRTRPTACPLLASLPLRPTRRTHTIKSFLPSVRFPNSSSPRPRPGLSKPLEPGPLGGASSLPGAAGGGVGREGRPAAPAPPPPRGPVGSACLGHMSHPPASPGPAPHRPRHPRRCPPPATRPPARLLRLPPLRCLHPGLGRGLRRSCPPRPAPARRARAMGLGLPPRPASPG